MKIIGIVRYAIPNAFSGIKTVKSRDVVKLYEDPYFTDRFNVFYNITLESFKNQTNKDFVLCIYHTDQIPEDKKRLFNKIEEECPFVRCVYVSDDKMPIPEDLKEQNMLTFRIDNDDGVPVDFIDRLRNSDCEKRNALLVQKQRFQVTLAFFPRFLITHIHIHTNNLTGST